jgi:tetratricopeptide (TPR) repeat protein
MLNNSYQQDSTVYITTYYLALSMMEMNQFAEADKIFHKTINLCTPSFLEEVYIRKAICCENEMDYNESMENYKRAIHFAPDRKDVNYYIATLVDKYYQDIELSIKKYQYFLKNSSGCDADMVAYAEVRLEELKEQKLFGN